MSQSKEVFVDLHVLPGTGRRLIFYCVIFLVRKSATHLRNAIENHILV